MQHFKLIAVAVLAAAAGSVLVYRLWPASAGRTPTYDWQCTKCQYQFRLPVRKAADDRPVVECPKCHAMAAERIMHYQCRNCWHKYDLRGTRARLPNIVCPSCGSRAARDLDHLIPGDDEPVEGGQPYPRN